jgi:hypothetical protein
LSPEALWSAVRLLVTVSPRELVLEIAISALSDGATPQDLRGVWSFVALMLEPALKLSQFATEWPPEQIGLLYERALENDLYERLNRVSEDRRTEREAATIALLGPITSPKDQHVSGRVMRPARLSDAVRSAVNWLASRKDPPAGQALVTLLDTANLAQWKPTLLHAWSVHSMARRDADFTHSPTAMIRAALAGGPPVNGADLRAIVVEVLRGMAGELHTSSTTPWKRYWNTDQSGSVTDPRIENQCRDYVLDRLIDRVRPYGIAIAIPEAQLAESRRADMLIATGAGRSLPIEVKRHFHPDVWPAASTQLQDYVTHESSDGFGLYLVLWFGVAGNRRRLPLRPSGKKQPSTAADLESALTEDLPDEMRRRTDVIVFDVSEQS